MMTRTTTMMMTTTMTMMMMMTMTTTTMMIMMMIAGHVVADGEAGTGVGETTRPQRQRHLRLSPLGLLNTASYSSPPILPILS